MKIYFKKAFIVLIIWGLFSPAAVSAENDDGWGAEELNFDDDLDGLDIDNLDFPDDIDPDDIDPDETRLPALPPLVEAGFYQDIISGPLWKKSFSPRGRDALYMIPYKLRKFDHDGFLLNLFYNQTSRMNVTAGTFFNFDFSETQEQTFARLLSAEFGAIDAEDFATLSHLLKKLSVTERKSGFLLNGRMSLGRFTFGIDSSIHLSERNIITSKKDEKRIRELVAAHFGDGAIGEIDLEGEFARIRIGLGDTRLKLGLKAIDFKDFKVHLGTSLILPTAMGVLRDGHFSWPKRASLSEFGNEIEKIRNIFLKPELGNNEHFGFGLFLETRLSLYNDWMNIWSRAIFDDFIPSRERRLVIFKNRISPSQIVDKVGAVAGDDAAEEAVIKEFRRQYLVPTEIEASVNPGSVFMYTIFCDWKLNDKWKFGLGYDFYTRQREEIEKIYRSTDPDVGANIDIADLRIGQAENDTAVQHKISTEINYDVKLKNSRITVGLGGDYTVMREGIGRDWTIYSKLGWKF